MDLNPMLSTEVIITSQPIVQVNPIYIIIDRIPTMNQRQQPQQPNTFTRRRAQQQQQTTALTQRQLARQRRRRIQRQRRRERREEQRRQQQTERPRNHEPVVQWTWQPTIQIFNNYEWTEEDYEHFNYTDYMDRSLNDSVYESYELERLKPRERWEHEQLNELEGFAALEQLLLMEHDIEEQNRMSLTSTIIIEEEQEQIIDEQ